MLLYFIHPTINNYLNFIFFVYVFNNALGTAVPEADGVNNNKIIRQVQEQYSSTVVQLYSTVQSTVVQ